MTVWKSWLVQEAASMVVDSQKAKMKVQENAFKSYTTWIRHCLSDDRMKMIR